MKRTHFSPFFIGQCVYLNYKIYLNLNIVRQYTSFFPRWKKVLTSAHLKKKNYCLLKEVNTKILTHNGDLLSFQWHCRGICLLHSRLQLGTVYFFESISTEALRCIPSSTWALIFSMSGPASVAFTERVAARKYARYRRTLDQLRPPSPCYHHDYRTKQTVAGMAAKPRQPGNQPLALREWTRRFVLPAVRTLSGRDRGFCTYPPTHALGITESTHSHLTRANLCSELQRKRYILCAASKPLSLLVTNGKAVSMTQRPVSSPVSQISVTNPV